MTYWESQKTLRSSPLSAVDRSRSSTAMGSPRLFVAFFQPPACQQPSSMYQGHPAGPGSPSAEPSAAAMILNGAPWKVRCHSFTLPTVAVPSPEDDRRGGGPDRVPRLGDSRRDVPAETSCSGSRSGLLRC